MRNKFTSFVIAVIIAFGLWLYVVTTVSQESDDTFYNIPIVMEGESVLMTERNLMITDVSATDVDLTLSGNRSDLIKVNSGNITVKVDLTKVYEAGERISLIPNISFPGDVAANALVVQNKNPGSIFVTVEERRNKEVPVEVKWVGSTPEGYMSDRENRTLDYSFINVVGPASVADQIEKAVIEVNLNEQRESISESYRYTLCDAQGNAVDAKFITTNVEEVRLDVKIQQVKEVKLVLDVVYGGGTTERNTAIEIVPATIRLSGSEAVLENLGEVIVLGKIDLGVIEKSQSLTYPITLPEGITNLSNIDEAQADIKFYGLTVKEFVIENIVPINVPEGLEVDLITEKLTIVLRGNAAEIARIEPEDISVTVDFTGAAIGTTTFKPIIKCADEFTNLGYVGTYWVSATLREPVEE